MVNRCDYCGRTHGWTTMTEGDTGLTICDQCISLCVLSLEKMSIEQRIVGLRNVMQDAIDFERAKNLIGSMELEIAELKNGISKEAEHGEGVVADEF